MRRYFFFAILLILILTGYWIWNHRPELREKIQRYVENKEFLTLETRYPIDHLLQANLSEKEGEIVKQPFLSYFPYLLMEVNFVSADKNSHQGIMLWNMIDGEMVVDADKWEMSSGFRHCIASEATRADFKIMNALARHGGRASTQTLMHEMGVQRSTIEPWIESALRKNLVKYDGRALALKIDNSKFYISPVTKINEWLITKSYRHARRNQEKFSQKQIEAIAQSAFGINFKIRESKVVYLPIYTVEVEHLNGSTKNLFWNALTGSKIDVTHMDVQPS